MIVDLILPDKDAYLTPDGPRRFRTSQGKNPRNRHDDETLEVVSTLWGPIMDHDHQDRPRVQRWVAHDTEGVNMGLMNSKRRTRSKRRCGWPT